MRSAQRPLVGCVRSPENVGIGILPRQLGVQRAMAGDDHSGGEAEVTLRLIAVTGGETDHTHSGNDVDLWNGMKIVLGVKGHVVLLEVARAELPTYTDDLARAASSIGGIIEIVARCRPPEAGSRR